MKRHLLSLADTAALFGAGFAILAGFGSRNWFCELFMHWRLQLAACFAGYALLQLGVRRYHHAAAAAILACLLARILLAGGAPCPHAAAADGHRLRILQANILTSNTNAPALLALIARENPDVIVLQEPNTRWLSDLAPLTNAYPVFAAEPREDNFGAAIFCRANARAAEIVHLSDPERAPSTRARVGIGGRTLTVMGTHPLAPYNAYTWHGRNRYTLELARLLRDTPGPRVITGDFNNTPWSTHLRAFQETSGLLDSQRGRFPQLTWPAFFPPFLRIPIDHCFHSADVQIIARRPGPHIGSDHLPLVIDLAF